MTPPTRLGKYEVRREIGKGSMGVVYEAFDPVIQRRVALKVIRQDEFGQTQGVELSARLRREAQAAGRLSHPGIVAIYDFGEDDTAGGGNVAFIAMEFVEGRELKQLLADGQRLKPQEVVRIVLAVLAALQHAHERGVTHRDIKPANVILLADGTVKLADFGVARIETSELTQAGTIIGTPMYMSPEQILGLAVDGRSDLFSCGVLLYEMLTGAKPFNGSVATVIRQVLEVEPVPPSQADSTLGPRWDALMQRALAKKPEQRFASAREMAAAVQEAAHLDADVTVAAPAVALAAPPEVVVAASGPRWRVVGAAAAVLAAAAAALHLAWPVAAPSVTRMPVAASAPGATAALVVAVPSPASGSASAATQAPALEPLPAASMPIPEVMTAALPTPAQASRPSANASVPVASTRLRTEAKAPVSSARDWAARLDAGRLEATPLPATLNAALRRALDPFDAGDAARLVEFESLLVQQRPPFAYALAVAQGRLVHAWAWGVDGANAGINSRRRCAERHQVVCQVVMVDGALRRQAFFDVARGLGAQPAPAVRAALMQTLADAAPELRREQAARQKSEVARAAPPERVAAPASTASAQAPVAPADWTKARARLREASPRELDAALALLLGAESASERRQLERFQAQIKRLRWKSALAMGVTANGHLAWSYQQGEPRSDWAEERAVSRCAQAAKGGCALVAVNGDYRAGALNDLMGRFGARSQAVVRDAFLRSAVRQFP